MRWQFHYPKRTSFYPPDCENPGLGGCEASLVLLTRALAARGHAVEVFNCCYRPGTYDGVTWRMTWELDSAPAPDVAVAVRFDEALWPTASQAEQHLFWMLDDRSRGPAAFAESFQDRGGLVILASQAMQNRLDAAGVDIPTQLTPLPVETDRYTQPVEDRAPHLPLRQHAQPRPRCRPRPLAPHQGRRPQRRALDHQRLATLGLHQLRIRRPVAPTPWRPSTPGRRPSPRHASPSRTHPNPAAGRPTLYPCRFPEMFCLSAAESAAAGTPVITSPIDALAERVQHNQTGILIDGDIDHADTQRAFADASIALLINPGRRNTMGTAGRTGSAHLLPERVASAWEALVSGTV
ncbi:glycosyltransferase [Streptomyces sp. NPDC002917]|uniref:glycosyltransferase n=1 Tax=Streptomyces sp. NPDC002917 TaxID=3364671 RepID=UPI0036A4E92D